MSATLMKVVFSKNFPGLGEKIKQLRKDSSRSLTQLAADAGISVTHWNRIENEKITELPVETLGGMEKALNINLKAEYGD